MFANRLLRPFLGILALAGALSPLAPAQNLQVNPFSLNVFYQKQAEASPSVQRTLDVSNIRSRVRVSTTVEPGVNWLFVSPTELNVGGGATAQLTVTIAQVGALNPGTYTGSVNFAPEVGSPVTIPVTLVVSTLRMQNAIPSSLEIIAQRNTVRTDPVPIRVTATSGSLTITSATLTSWLAVDSGPVGTPGTINVSALPGNLPVGDYNGNITLVAAGNSGETLGNPSLTIPVRLRVVDDSRLSVAPTAIGFDYQINGPTPAARTVAVTSTGAQVSFTTEIATPGTNVQWLTVGPTAGSTPQNLSIGLQNLSGLAAGTYTGTIAIKVSTGQTETVTVTLRVATDPLLTLQPGQLTFTYQQNGAQPPRQTVIASNLGNSVALTATPATSSPWVTVSTPSGSTPAAIVVGVNTANLQPGTYNGAVVLSGAFGNSPLQLPVQLVVSASTQPLLRVSQNQLNFAFQTGGGATTLSQTIDVSSTGAALQYAATAQNGTGWLSVSPTTNQNTPSSLTVSVSPGSLPPNVYNGQITILTPDQNAVPIIVPVRMVISTQPLLNVAPSSLTFNATGSSTVLRQSISVRSTGNNFAYQATASITGGGNWLIAQQTGANTGSSVDVAVSPTVSEGAGLVTITAAGIENSPVFVPVTLTSTGPTSQLTVTPAVLDFAQVIGGTPAAAQLLDVSLGQGTGFTSYSIGDIRYLNGANWIKLNKTGGIAPDKVEVSIDATNLQPGRYAASILFSSSVGNREVAVFLEVRPQVATAFTVSPETLTFNFTPGGAVPAAQQLQIGSTAQAISFTATAAVAQGLSSWLTLNTNTGTTPAVLQVSVNPANLAPGTTYQGTITLASASGALTRTVNVTLNVAAGPTPNLSRMVNAASFLDVVAVPGTIVTFLGTSLGPAVGIAAAPNASGVFERQLANVKVYFDTFEAPLLYVSATQVNAIVPYQIAPRVSTRVQLEVNGVRSNGLDLRVGTAAPGIFLLNAAGQGAILNQDLTVNGSNNPAARDSVIVIYATGEGQTNPPGVDGTIPGRSTNLKTPVQRVRVRIGGQEAEVQYAGSAPFLVSGALQVNAKVPIGITPGPGVPIELIVGDVSSPAGVTVAIR